MVVALKAQLCDKRSTYLMSAIIKQITIQLNAEGHLLSSFTLIYKWRKSANLSLLRRLANSRLSLPRIHINLDSKS